MSERPVVAIEDSDEDFEILVRALRQAGVANPVYRCAEAEEVDDLLAGRSHWPSVLRGSYPLLVLLDLNFPGADWRETLQQLRSSPWWQPVPVVIVSTSSQPTTVFECYSLGAAGYLQKTLAPHSFAAAIRRLAAYWLETVVPPVPPEQGMLEHLPVRT